MRAWWKRLCDRWDCWSPRKRAVLRWAGPLAGLAVVVGVVWLFHHRSGPASPAEARGLLTRVGIAAAFAALVLLAGARRWRLQGLGLLAFLFGVAGFFIRIVGRRGPQPTPEWERDLVQSLLDVGSAALPLGLVLWVVARRLGRGGSDAASDEMAGPSIHEGYDRRSGRERRKNWTPKA